MRVFAVILLVGALLVAGCRSTDEGRPQGLPAPAPITQVERHPRPYRDVEPNRLSVGVVEIPVGLPTDGIEPGRAIQERTSEVWVVGAGAVERILRDDTKPPRHQRLVARLHKGGTVMIVHNIDLAPRVPLKRGDHIAFRGEYVWNDQGGVIHWTHRDKRDKRAGGWIVWKGQTFR
jgi:hypothetical protein